MSTVAASAALWSPDLAHPAAPGARLARWLGIAAVHGLVAWALLQGDVLQAVLRESRPLMVALVSEAPLAPHPAAPTPEPAARNVPPPAPALPPPEITVAQAAPAPVAAPVIAQVAPTVVPALPQPAAVAVEVRPPRAPSPPQAQPAAPRQLPAGAIRYRVPPAIEVPMASRRLGESGTVLLRVLVDATGLPRQISLHRSSGFARLDEQALAAMRAARFQPVTEDGTAIEWLVIAPLQYEID
ncbi:MAG: hypothetical protein CFE45_10480 [Burkholderiales bacterium PBB5]|nr:MAG: hypothetical protein CFE45_10480 [Burkholderiales bacterium PBB5]